MISLDTRVTGHEPDTTSRGVTFWHGVVAGLLDDGWDFWDVLGLSKVEALVALEACSPGVYAELVGPLGVSDGDS